MTDKLVALCVELVADRANAADIPFPTTQIIDRIANELKDRGDQAGRKRSPSWSDYYPGGEA